MTNAEWLIQNKIPFKDINVYIDSIKKIDWIWMERISAITFFGKTEWFRIQNGVSWFYIWKWFYWVFSCDVMNQ